MDGFEDRPEWLEKLLTGHGFDSRVEKPVWENQPGQRTRMRGAEQSARKIEFMHEMFQQFGQAGEDLMEAARAVQYKADDLRKWADYVEKGDIPIESVREMFGAPEITASEAIEAFRDSAWNADYYATKLEGMAGIAHKAGGIVDRLGSIQNPDIRKALLEAEWQMALGNALLEGAPTGRNIVTEAMEFAVGMQGSYAIDRGSAQVLQELQGFIETNAINIHGLGSNTRPR